MARSHKKKVYNLRYLLLLYWLIFIVLTVLLSFALDMVTFNSDTNLFDISFTFLNTAVISADMAFFLIVRLKIINHYKGENEMAFNFEEESAPPIIMEETDEEEQRRKKKRKDTCDFEKIEVTREESFRLNPFWQSSSKDETFLKDCYNNNFLITLPETFDNVTIPKNFLKFYLNFNFIKISDNPNNKNYIEKTIIDCDDMQWIAKMVDNNMLIKAEIKFNKNLVEKDNLDKGSIKLLITISNINLQDKEKIIKFEYLPLKKTITEHLKTFIKKIKNCDKSEESIIEHSEQDFMSSTFITRKDMKSKNMIFSIKTGNKTKETYEVITSVYCAYSDIKCPICHNKIQNLGIRGIVTYLTNTPDVCETSKTIDSIINKLDSEDELKKMIYYVRDKNLKNSNVKNLFDENNHCARIPLAKYEKEKNEYKIKSFNHSNYEEEWDFLDKFNKVLFKDYMEQDEISNIKNLRQLVLLKPSNDGNNDEIINHYIHSSMIAQLCNNCYNPLPKDFYEYYQVISIKYFGDSSTGKTALICSEYNVNDGENFNEINFDKENLNSSYKEKAGKLKKGKFPIGTDETENIPGKLSVLPVDDNNGTTLKYLFNELDMMGAKAAQNWSSNQNIVYLHSLLSTTEIFDDTDNKKSLYTNVIETVQNVEDPRTYNIQIYLTKIDEFPLFLYETIKKHNKNYIIRLDPQQNQQLSAKEYLEISRNYMFELLSILNENLSESFYEKTWSDVIPEDIADYILNKLNIGHIINLEGTYINFFNYIVEHYIKKSTKDDDDKLILIYLYGIHFIQENYQKFKELICTLLTDMSRNAKINKYSYFWLSVYAVSATGFGKLRQTLNPGGEVNLFNPEFVKEASRLLKQTTRIFQHEAKVSRINGRANENMYCYNQLFANNLEEFITQLNNTPIVRPPYTEYEQWLKNWYNDLLNEKAEAPEKDTVLSC
ncbi:MAG: hypothetical protein K2K89_13830 [Ruminococcus sp.]|nr:hypothetical protein [Ruminococcus sp.]